MAWTYSGDPAANDRDAVRFLVGDTDTTDQQLNDAEIAYLNAQEPNVYKAASQGAKTIAAKFARKADKEVGDLKIRWSQLQKSYLDLASELEERSISGVGTAFLGGTNVGEKQTLDEDTDRVQPGFKRDQFDSFRVNDNISNLNS